MKAELPPLTCKRCGETWPPKVESPVQCPRCKSPFWNKNKSAKFDVPREE